MEHWRRAPRALHSIPIRWRSHSNFGHERINGIRTRTALFPCVNQGGRASRTQPLTRPFSFIVRRQFPNPPRPFCLWPKNGERYSTQMRAPRHRRGAVQISVATCDLFILAPPRDEVQFLLRRNDRLMGRSERKRAQHRPSPSSGVYLGHGPRSSGWVKRKKGEFTLSSGGEKNKVEVEGAERRFCGKPVPRTGSKGLRG